jgi:hypothetical protein
MKRQHCKPLIVDMETIFIRSVMLDASPRLQEVGVAHSSLYMVGTHFAERTFDFRLIKIKMFGSCEYSNELLGSIKCKTFLH